MDLRSMRFGSKKFYELFAGPNGNDADNLGTFRKLERGLSAASQAAKKFPYVVLHEYIGGRDDSDWNDTVFSQDKSQQEEECDMAKKKKAAAKSAVKVEKAATEGQSRNQLMETVKSRGIKNFRVMNKAELAEIVGGAKADRVLEIQKQAVERWKSGWGKKGGKE